ncbi:hypothetical protein C8R44DRAFT_985120 [Mycena epipterygia]|nr:hypothetical protein C8R44DRAFT_985120 [Mycena epipterygia]
MNSMSPELNALVLRARLTIKTLMVRTIGTLFVSRGPLYRLTDADADIESLDLSLFPALIFIDCDGLSPRFLQMLASLPAINTVRGMHLRIFRAHGQEGDHAIEYLQQFQVAISAVRMCALQWIELEVEPTLVNIDLTQEHRREELIAITYQ